MIKEYRLIAAKGRDACGRVQKRSEHQIFTRPLPRESGAALFSQHLCEAVLTEDCQTREVHLRLGFCSFEIV